MERRAIVIQGTVQGVGFRPFVHGLALRLQLTGFVKNQTGGVHIEVEGESASLDQFLSVLSSETPPLAQIDAVSWQRQMPIGDRGFHIHPSDRGDGGPIIVAPDTATCADCLRELLDPNDRRFGYPFLNCTHCGPRLTITTGWPYDRERTTMAAFLMCAACRAEYDNPADRRFHAQPTACAVCGPRLRLLDQSGRSIPGDDPIALFSLAIAEGKIGAVKGLGGYHLVCDAKNKLAVAALRSRKGREEKPFAVMVADLAAAEGLCLIDEAEHRLLASQRRPIVLLRKRVNSGLADEIAPQNPRLGVMLPYTPLHHLLMRALNGAALVMTSGNRSDEPIATDEADAISRLGGIADLFLTHNRPIHMRCDDSVTRIMGGRESLLRRSRGYAPAPIPLPFSCDAPILAVGGQLKAVFALGSDRRAVLSHHLGDLDHLEAYCAFERDIKLYEQLFSLSPRCIAHDLHPDYASTRYAARRGAQQGLPCVPVQHHHAHMASCMAEHGLTEPVIGVIFDGAGFGADGAIWGGEFLVGDYDTFDRAAHLRYVPMPGGEQATRQPWRMAAAYLLDAQVSCEPLEKRLPPASLRTVRKMIERKFNSPETSSMGRLFDAVASLAGVRDAVSHEGQAAMELEWLAESIDGDATYPSAYPFELIRTNKCLQIDVRPMIRAIAQDVEQGITAAHVSRRFHSTLAELIRVVCIELRNTLKTNSIVLSGGVFMNELLTIEARHRLELEGFAVYVHQRVPPNDGGLCLGQLAIAASRQRKHGCALEFREK